MIARARIASMAIGLLLGGVSARTRQLPASQSSPVPDQDLCTVAGHVVRADTGLPLKGAHFTLRPAGGGMMANYGTQSDDSGQFTVRRIQPGRYALRMEREGFVPQNSAERDAQRSETILTLGPGEKIEGLTFRMLAWSVVAGRVTDEDGEPLPNARVQLLRRAFTGGRRRLQVAGAAATNDLGEFRVWSLRPGRYYLLVSYSRQVSLATPPAGNTVTGTAPSMAYPAVFYPGKQETSQAVAIEVGGGQEIDGLDVRLTPTRAFSVRGRVWDAVRGQPLHGCCLYFFNAEDFGSRTYAANNSLDPAKGTFELSSVTPGSYEVSAITQVDGRQYVARTRVEVNNADVDGVELSIARGIAIRGIVSVEGGRAVELAGMTVNLVASGESPLGMGRVHSAQVKADGSFLVEDVPEGLHEVYVSRPQAGLYLKSERMNGQEILESGMSIGPGGTKGELEIVLSPAGATVDGAVLDADGQPVGAAQVLLVPEGEKRKLARFYYPAAADQYGKFAIHDVRPGNYKLFSWRKVEYGQWQDPEFIQRFEDKGASVSLQEQSHPSVELRVIPDAGPGDGPD